MKTKTTARVLSLVIALVTMFTLCFVLAAPASAESYEVTDKASLEAAIAAAKDGDVIYLTQDITLTDATATITISQDVTITSKQDEAKEGTEIYTITRAVGGFPMFTLGVATVTLENITIDGAGVADTTSNGGAFGIAKTDSARTLVIGEGATLKNLKAKNGGAAYVRFIEMNGGTVENCSASTNGGGLYVHAQFTMNGGTITGNTAGDTGGGVYVYVRVDTTTFTGGSITNNKAKTGGGVTLGGTKTTVISGTTISGNTTTSSYGGGIRVGGGTLQVTGGSISNNTATTNGGGIYLGGGSNHALTGGTISGNKGSSGGGVALATGTTLTVGGCTITGNTSTDAENGGGGIYSSAAGTLVFDNGATISKNVAIQGGGIFSLGTVTINDGAMISENTASATGAGVQIEGNLAMNGGTVTGNIATENGGGVYVVGELTVSGTAVISKNEAVSGGGIAVEGTLIMNGGTVTDNTATGNDTEKGGGGIYIATGATVTLGGNATVSANHAVRGGGILSLGALTVNENALITENASSMTGAGIQVVGEVTINGGTISANTATTTGGGLQIMSAGVVTMKGGSISNNTATTTGGGAYVAGTFALEGGDLSGNTANGTGGGAVYLTKKFTMIGGTISGNNAKAGAGLYVTGVNSDCTITGGSIKNNESSGAGAGIYGNTSATVKLGGNAEISGNIAGTTGGGIHMNGGWLTATGGRISANTATTTGGGLYTKTGGWVLIDGAEFSDNNAVDGGGIASASKTLVITGNTVISGNTATDQGGGIFLGGATSHLFLVGGTVENNTSAFGTAAGIEVSDGPTLVMLGGEITTHDGSYAVFATGVSKISLLGGSVVGNSAKWAVYAGENATVTLGKTFTLSAALADELVTAISGSVTVSEDGLTLTSTTPLEICDNTSENGNISGYVADTFNVTLAEDLVAGSRVEFNDNAETEGYFLTLAENYTPDKTTLYAIQLRGADAAYNAEIATGKLVWPTKAYQAYQNAGLQDNIAYRLYWAYRSASNKTLPTVTFDGETVELGTVSSSLAALIKEPYYEGLTYVEVRLAPKQISETISVVLGEENKTYTLVGYLNSIKEAGGTLGALVNATLNYGTAAQAYFGETEDRANANYQAEIADIAAASGTVLNQFADKTLPLFKSASVVLGDKVSVKIIIKQWVENFQYSVTLGGETYTPTTAYDAEDGLYMIVVENISACDLADRIVVTMTDGENTATLDYSVLEYAINKQGVAEGGLDYVAKALYAYANAAAAYVAAN